MEILLLEHPMKGEIWLVMAKAFLLTRFLLKRNSLPQDQGNDRPHTITDRWPYIYVHVQLAGVLIVGYATSPG